MGGVGGKGVEESIKVRHSRWDLVLNNIAMTPQFRGNWWVGGLTALSVATLLLCFGRVESSLSGLLTAVLIGMLTASAVVVLVVGFASIKILTAYNPDEGVLGEHVYTFQEDGLREQTVANDTVVKWGRAHQVRRFRSFIAIFVAPGLFHVLPRSAFRSEAEYEGFWATAQRLARGHEAR